jgi:predicted small lipoprotein YifL
MTRKIFAVLPLVLALTACGRGGPHYYGGNVRAMMVRPDESTNQSFSYDHMLDVAMARDNVAPRYERTRDRCLRDVALHCTLLSATIDLSSGDEAGSGNTATIVASLPHDKIAGFEAGVLAPIAGQDNATVRSRSTTAENVTQESGDATRKVTQLTDYRNRLAEIAKRPGLSVDDLIKVEGELAKAQSDLDEATSKKEDVGDRATRERVTVSMEEHAGVGDAFRPVGRIWRSSLELLGESTASALQFLIELIPWLPVIAGASFLVRWLWRIARRRPAVAQSPSGKTSGG